MDAGERPNNVKRRQHPTFKGQSLIIALVDQVDRHHADQMLSVSELHLLVEKGLLSPRTQSLAEEQTLRFRMTRDQISVILISRSLKT